MHIVFFTHPDFLGHQSMPRYTQLLAEGMKARGHKVEMWTPRPRLMRFGGLRPLKKWLGYMDQYLVFPLEVKKRLRRCTLDTLFVFTDHALGPWVPLVKKRAHVIHCHDFLAQRSAQHEIEENPTGWTGRRYQSFIRRGYSMGKHFISVSQKTRDELHRFLPASPQRSEVVYNGLTYAFQPCESSKVRALLACKTRLELSGGYLLHVGGNQWYKNRLGVIEIYEAWRKNHKTRLPLLMIGEPPASTITKRLAQSPYTKDIYWLSGLSNEWLAMAYAGASVLVFPSTAEGFGWPIAEAMASGCPVITTHEAPMTEVAGTAGFFIPRRPYLPEKAAEWAAGAARVVDQVIGLAPAEREKVVVAGLANARRFDPKHALDKIEGIYYQILQDSVIK